ncbi:MAG: hypothetical protein HUK22_00295, partial [Thermoguttaceae bacterium]|nr:hypothetical protein [Thermoguttaceae bacterium]
RDDAGDETDEANTDDANKAAAPAAASVRADGESKTDADGDEYDDAYDDDDRSATPLWARKLKICVCAIIVTASVLAVGYVGYLYVARQKSAPNPGENAAVAASETGGAASDAVAVAKDAKTAEDAKKSGLFTRLKSWVFPDKSNKSEAVAAAKDAKDTKIVKDDKTAEGAKKPGLFARLKSWIFSDKSNKSEVAKKEDAAKKGTAGKGATLDSKSIQKSIDAGIEDASAAADNLAGGLTTIASAAQDDAEDLLAGFASDVDDTETDAIKVSNSYPTDAADEGYAGSSYGGFASSNDAPSGTSGAYGAAEDEGSLQYSNGLDLTSNDSNLTDDSSLASNDVPTGFAASDPLQETTDDDLLSDAGTTPSSYGAASTPTFANANATPTEENAADLTLDAAENDVPLGFG